VYTENHSPTTDAEQANFHDLYRKYLDFEKYSIFATTWKRIQVR
jgi:hypothetical protein